MPSLRFGLQLAIVCLGLIGLLVLLVLPSAAIDLGDLHITVNAMDMGAYGKWLMALLAGAAALGGLSLRLGLARWLAVPAAGCFAAAVYQLRQVWAQGAYGSRIALVVAALGVLASLVAAVLGPVKSDVAFSSP